jgi:hypothetical protein
LHAEEDGMAKVVVNNGVGGAGKTHGRQAARKKSRLAILRGRRFPSYSQRRKDAPRRSIDGPRPGTMA